MAGANSSLSVISEGLNAKVEKVKAHRKNPKK
jgi:hypothetical protein